MRRSTATTLQDVAREAGVSAMTVSVVLNGARTATRVSDATRARIVEAAARLRYRPNGAARGLQRRRMETVGVVAIIDHGSEADLNLYFLEVLNGILEEASARGQNTTVLSIGSWESDRERVLQFCDGRVDGMVLIAPFLNTAFVETLRHHTPFVAIHGDGATDGVWNLTIDDEAGAYEVVSRMIARGHRRILHITGPRHLTGARMRLEGYKRALAEAGIPYDPSLVIPGEYCQRAGWDAMTEVLESGRLGAMPAALFAASDAIAIGAGRAIVAHGLRIPDDISLAGFDDTLAARMHEPPLTSARQPLREFGHLAVELLLQLISADGATGPDGEPAPDAVPATRSLPVQVIERASVISPRPPLPESGNHPGDTPAAMR